MDEYPSVKALLAAGAEVILYGILDEEPFFHVSKSKDGRPHINVILGPLEISIRPSDLEEPEPGADHWFGYGKVEFNGDH